MVFVRVFAGFNSTRVLRTQCQLIHFRFDSFTRPRALSLSFFSRMQFGCCNFLLPCKSYVYSFICLNFVHCSRVICLRWNWVFWCSVFEPCVLVVFFIPVKASVSRFQYDSWFVVSVACSYSFLSASCDGWFITCFYSPAWFFLLLLLLTLLSCSFGCDLASRSCFVVRIFAFYSANTSLYQCCASKRIKWRINWMNKTVTRCVLINWISFKLDENV